MDQEVEEAEGLTTPPGSPSDGAVYIPGSGATGAWASWDFNLAYYVDGAWQKIVPKVGWIVYDIDQGGHYVYVGAPDYWVDFVEALGAITMGGNIALNGNWLSGDGDDEGVFVAGDGKVGINTNSPARPFHIVGGDTFARIDRHNSSSPPGVLLVHKNTAGDTVIQTWGFAGGNAGFQVQDYGTAVSGGNDKALTILKGSGKTGIGYDVTNPAFMLEVEGDIGPYQDDASNLGSASRRFDDIHATNGTIQTSDAGDKDIRGPLSEAELRAGGRMGAVVFRWLSAIAEKGEAARQHVGFVAQHVRDALLAEGLDPGDYGFFIETPLMVQQVRIERRTVERNKTRKVARERIVVEDGEPKLVTEEVEELVGKRRPVTKDGEPVIDPRTKQPLTHFVPEVETVTEEEPFSEMVPAIDERTGQQKVRLGLRMGELMAFLDACRRAQIAALEARVAALEGA